MPEYKYFVYWDTNTGRDGDAGYHRLVDAEARYDDLESSSHVTYAELRDANDNIIRTCG